MPATPEPSPFSPIYIAARDGDLGKVKALAEADPHLVHGDDKGVKPLEIAAIYGKLEVAEWLLSQGAEVVSLSGAPTREMAVLLHAHGAEVNPKNGKGSAPLLSAAASGRTEVAEFLLDHKAEANVKGANGWAPLHFAAYYNYFEIAKMLLASGADANAVSSDGQTPLHAAVSYKGNKEMVELLLANRAEVGVKDKDGKTPLHIAVCERKKDAVESLLLRGAEPDVKDNRGKTPLQWAIIKEEDDIAKLLRRQGARDPGEPDPITKCDLPPGLIEAAKILEQQSRARGIKARRIPIGEWNRVPPDIRDMIPNWLPTLLADFSLSGAVFELSNFGDQTWPLYFSFWGPGNYEHNFHGKSRYCFADEFIADGFTIISDESDGNVWLTRISAPASSPIYFFDLSGHERIPAGDGMESLMKRMTVSAG